MATKNFAFVDSNNHTLANFSPTTPGEDLSDELNALRAQDPDRPVFLLRSRESPGHNDAVDIVTDAALKVLGNGVSSTATVEVLHASPPNFLADPKENDVYPRANYQSQAMLVVSQDNSLNDAYRYSQNIDFGWNPLRPARSSSVGDVFVLGGQAYMVASIGFVAVDLV